MVFALTDWSRPCDSFTFSLTFWRGNSAGEFRGGHLLSQGAEGVLDLCEGLAFGFPLCSVALREEKGLRRRNEGFEAEKRKLREEDE